MRGLVRAATVIALLLPALSAAPNWLHVRSQNFDLLTTASEKRAREAILYFEQVRGFFLEVNRWTDDSRTRVRIVAFDNEEQYRPFRTNDFSPAYCINGQGEDWIVMRGIGPQSYPVAVHEYSHVALKRAGLDLPPWLNEGLADLNSTLRPSGNQVGIGHFMPGRARTLRERKWIDLEVLAGAGYDSPLYLERERAGLFYAESWALTHMLALSDGYRAKFRPFLKAVRSGAGTAAFEQAFGKTPAQVQKDLADYLRGNAFPTAVFPIKLERSAEQPEVRPATELEVGMTLADLLAVLDRFDEARSRYRELAVRYPREPGIEEAFANLELRAKRRDEARLHMARAVALGSVKPDIFFDYAMLLSEAGAPDAEISRHLKRATELKPGYDDAYYFLGMSLLNQGSYREGLESLGHVAHVPPSRAATLARAKARAQYELGGLEQARKDAAQALALAQNDDDKTKAGQLLAFLNQPASPTQPQRVNGSFEELECLGKAVRLWIGVNGKRLAFDIPDLERIRITGGEFDFPCGAQNGRGISIDYEFEGSARRVTAISLR